MIPKSTKIFNSLTQNIYIMFKFKKLNLCRLYNDCPMGRMNLHKVATLVTSVFGLSDWGL